MSVRLLLVSFVFLLGTRGFTQNLMFQVSGGVHHLVNQDYSHEYEATVFTSRPWYFEDDTFSINQQVIARETYTTYYYGKIGYNATVDLMIPVGSRVFLSTGLGFNYSAYSYTSDYDIDFIDTLSTDTVPHSGSFLPGGGFSTDCDCYENSYLDVRNQIRFPSVRSLSLSIPVKVNFDILPRKLSLNIGAYGQIPLWIEQKKSNVSIEQHESEGMTKCEYVVLQQVDLSGNGIRRLQVGLSAGIQVSLFDGFGLNVGVSKMLTNTYVSHEYQSTYSVKDYRPYQVSAGVVYTFRQNANRENVY